jgi:effector-binding domain-containing protein
MSKKLFVVLIAGVLLLMAALFPFSVSEKVEINASFSSVAEQFLNNTKLAKWMLPFAGEKKEDVTIHTSGAIALQTPKEKLQKVMPDKYAAVFILAEKGKEKKATFAISPLNNDLHNSIVTLTYKTNYLSRLLKLQKAELIFSESLKNLKTYMEDPLQFYGYEMKIATVSDTAFLVSKIVATKQEINQKANALYENLISFAEKNNGGYTGVRIFHKERITENEYFISVGVGVTTVFPVTAAPGIDYKKMPFQKNLLVTTYTGPYGEIWKAYEAIEHFKTDNNLSSMAISFEKIPDGPVNFNDSEMVKVEIYYPIF